MRFTKQVLIIMNCKLNMERICYILSQDSLWIIDADDIDACEYDNDNNIWVIEFAYAAAMQILG